MKKILIIAILTIAISLPFVSSAQNPPHPNGGNPPSGDTNRVGHGPENGAPVGSGTLILFALGAAYATSRMLSGKTNPVT